MVIICFCISFSLLKQVIKSILKAKQETSVKSYDVSNEIQPRMGGDCIFSDDFF